MSASGAPTRRPREVDHVLAPVNDIAIAVGPHGVGCRRCGPLRTKPNSKTAVRPSAGQET